MNEVRPEDSFFMQRALALALQGRGWVNPNPMVGAVIVKQGRIVGEGYHARCGEAHAEAGALAQAGALARGSTLYVNLEPCTHYGRTPPCTDAILAAGIGRVVFACWDPNPVTFRRSLALLEGAGLKLTHGVEELAAIELNLPYFKWVRSGLPYVYCKMATSLDGKIATGAGKSRWISGPAARDLVHEWRASFASIMVGIGTVLADDPGLRCRVAGAPNPARIVADPDGATPVAARLLAGPGRVLVAVAPTAPTSALALLRERGAEVYTLAIRRQEPETLGLEQFDFQEFFLELGSQGISSILLEGGGGLNAAIIRQGLVDRLGLFVAPLVLGGTNAPTTVAGADIVELDSGIRLHHLRSRPIGDDLLVEADFAPSKKTC